MICLCSKSLKFFRTSKNALNSDYFEKIAQKIAKSKYFPNILNGNLSHSKIIRGGGGTPHRRILLFCKIV